MSVAGTTQKSRYSPPTGLTHNMPALARPNQVIEQRDSAAAIG